LKEGKIDGAERDGGYFRDGWNKAHSPQYKKIRLHGTRLREGTTQLQGKKSKDSVQVLRGGTKWNLFWSIGEEQA